MLAMLAMLGSVMMNEPTEPGAGAIANDDEETRRNGGSKCPRIYLHVKEKTRTVLGS
jgi:hypothetical protein